MPKTRKERLAAENIQNIQNIENIKLALPDRSAPRQKTLLEIAQEKDLFAQASAREASLRSSDHNTSSKNNKKNDSESLLSPQMERLLDAALWTSTLAMLHFTFDVFVHNQYAMAIEWGNICLNTARAWIVFFVVLYPLHPHPASSLPLLPRRFHHPLRQAIFFATSCAAGCFLIYVTNSKGYMYNMRRAPTLSCLWLWAVVELDLPWAVLSLAVAVGFLLKNGYTIR